MQSSYKQIWGFKLFNFNQKLCALPLIAMVLATPAAAATVIASGTIGSISEDNPPSIGEIAYPGSSGVYTFKTAAEVVNYSDISINLYVKSHGHTDDDKYGWGHNNYQVGFSQFGQPDPTYVYNPDGYSVSISIPPDFYAHYDDCWHQDSCGYWEEQAFTTFAYLSMTFTPESAGKAWSFEFTPFTTPVPEPGTWAFMIGGFGLAGTAIRRSRRQLARA